MEAGGGGWLNLIYDLKRNFRGFRGFYPRSTVCACGCNLSCMIAWTSSVPFTVASSLWLEFGAQRDTTTSNSGCYRR